MKLLRCLAMMLAIANGVGCMVWTSYFKTPATFEWMAMHFCGALSLWIAGMLTIIGMYRTKAIREIKHIRSIGRYQETRLEL